MEEDNKILDKYVGCKIKERRKSLGLTQAELAEILGLSHQQVQRYESGENTISMARAIELARRLNVKLNYFYDGAPLTDKIGKKIENGLYTKESNRAVRLLLVEDSSSDEILFRKAVSKSNVSTDIHVIQNPENVMDFLTKHRTEFDNEKPDIIVLDINMPRLSGIGLLKKIKSNVQLKNLPVIMLTNSVRSKDLLDSYANQANGFIQKNSDLQAFYEEIDLVLQYWSRAVVLPSYA